MKIQDLTPSERILLAEELWDSLENDQKSVALTSEQVEELDRRLQAFGSDRDPGSSWQEVKNRITGGN